MKTPDLAPVPGLDPKSATTMRVTATAAEELRALSQRATAARREFEIALGVAAACVLDGVLDDTDWTYDIAAGVFRRRESTAPQPVPKPEE